MRGSEKGPRRDERLICRERSRARGSARKQERKRGRERENTPGSRERKRERATQQREREREHTLRSRRGAVCATYIGALELLHNGTKDCIAKFYEQKITVVYEKVFSQVVLTFEKYILL